MSLSRQVRRAQERADAKYLGRKPGVSRPLLVGAPAEPDLRADKGKENGACNRTACQRPLAGEPTHQFMSGSFAAGGRLYYCAKCARGFDDWDHRSGDRVRIEREAKVAA